MKINKTILSVAVGLALGGGADDTYAALIDGMVLKFDDAVIGCVIGGTYPDNCLYGVSGIVSGSYFAMDQNGSGSFTLNEKVPMALGPDGGVILGQAQSASGSHTGVPNGSETPGLDQPWNYFGNTGMHFTTNNGVTVRADDNLDFTGWRVAWNRIPEINMGGDPANFGLTDNLGYTAILCDNAGDGNFVAGASLCNNGDRFTLDYRARVPKGDPSNFGGVLYGLYLEGTVSAVPVPAAAWLFGSGLLGLLSVARRKR